MAATDILPKGVSSVLLAVSKVNSGYLSPDGRHIICNFCDQLATEWLGIVHTDGCAVRQAQILVDLHFKAKAAKADAASAKPA